MTPLQMIKQGILTQDFNLVAQGYTTLTGEVLAREKSESQEVVRPSRDSNARPYNLEDFNMQIVDKSKQVNGKGEKLTRSEPVDLKKIKIVGNLFSDAKDIAPEDTELFDKKVHIKMPVQRTRPISQGKQKYECEDCGAEEELLPIHVPTDRYVCPKCTKKKMKRGG